MTFRCEHGTDCHGPGADSAATAPQTSRAWLLIEHQGPWPAEAVQASFGGSLGEFVREADSLGVRVQLIRRPGRRVPACARNIFAGWTPGESPWLRHRQVRDDETLDLPVADLAAGLETGFGKPAEQPLFLVCTHGRRDVCCARYGGPLASALAATYPVQVWETTHVDGHRFAANLVLLPHGLYYGPVDLATATAAITAYERGEVLQDRYRGRAGHHAG